MPIKIAAGMPTGSSMARLRDLRNTLLSRMTISSGLADAADAAASSIVSGCDDDMNERYIDFFTPFTALVMAPFLPKPRGHSPEDSSSALSRTSPPPCPKARGGARARPRVEPRARSARRRVVRRGWHHDAHRARGRARRRRTPRRRERARPSNLLEHGRVLTPAVSFVRRDGDARSGARRAPIVLRLAVQSQPTMPAWRQSAKDLSRTKSVARRRVIGAFRARFFPGSRTEKYHTFLDSNATPVALFRPASGNDAFLLSRSAAATTRSRGAKINRSRGNGEVDGTIRFVSALPRSRILAAVARARALVSTRKRASGEHTRVISQRCTKRTH